jgi:ELWxxDGT repeat protein
MYIKLQISLFLIAIFTVTGIAQSVRLVKDITPGTASTFSSDYIPVNDGIVAGFKDKVLFVVKDVNNALSLWTSNGEEDSTYIVHQLAPGETFLSFTNEDTSNVYYVVRSGNNRTLFALSKSTMDTSSLITSGFHFDAIKYFKNEVYYATNSKLMKVNPESKASELIFQFGSFRGIRDMQVLNDKLIIIGGVSNGTELFASDGTTGGTSAYFQLNNGNEGNAINYMTTVDDKLFFFYEPDEAPHSLYVTDGTTSGTMPLVAIRRDLFAQNLNSTRSIFGWNGKLYFKGNPATEPGNSEELYVSNGTVAGTIILQDDNENHKPDYFTPYKNVLYFSGNAYGDNFQVFKTNGTPAGTSQAINPNSLGTGGIGFGGDYMVVHKDSLYLAAWRIETGFELWSSAGTTATTKCLDLVPGTASSIPSQMTSTDNYLFLMYNSPEYGKELFVLDHITVSTKDISDANFSVFPNPFKDNLILNFDENRYSEFQVEILNLEGKLVFQSTASNNQKINGSSLPSGTYIVNLKNGDKVISKKVIKY